jgi:hypothetical protein
LPCLPIPPDAGALAVRVRGTDAQTHRGTDARTHGRTRGHSSRWGRVPAKPTRPSISPDLVVGGGTTRHPATCFHVTLGDAAESMVGRLVAPLLPLVPHNTFPPHCLTLRHRHGSPRQVRHALHWRLRRDGLVLLLTLPHAPLRLSPLGSWPSLAPRVAASGRPCP